MEGALGPVPRERLRLLAALKPHTTPAGVWAIERASGHDVRRAIADRNGGGFAPRVLGNPGG
jgi:hypothetical protein